MIYEWYVWLVLLTAEYCSIIRPYRVVDSTEWSSFTLVSNSDCTIASYFIYTVKEMMIFHAKIDTRRPPPNKKDAVLTAVGERAPG